MGSGTPGPPAGDQWVAFARGSCQPQIVVLEVRSKRAVGHALFQADVVTCQPEPARLDWVTRVKPKGLRRAPATLADTVRRTHLGAAWPLVIALSDWSLGRAFDPSEARPPGSGTMKT